MTAACLSVELLALAASDEAVVTDDPIADHLAGCATCRMLVHAQRAARSALAVIPAPPPLAHHTRVELGDLLAATSRPRARGPRFVLAASVASVALVAVVALASYAILRPSPDTSIAVPAPARAPIITPLPPLDTADQSPAERFVIEPFAGASYELDHDRVRVRGGGARIQSPTPIVVELGGAAVTVTGHVELRAPRGVIASVHVFAGSAQVTNASRVTTIVAGETWLRPGEPSVSPQAASADTSWFAIGWIAYREGRDADAIAAFDRVDDPAVVEDAAFWAARAAERSGDVAGARSRFERFLERFPSSDRGDSVRARLTER